LIAGGTFGLWIGCVWVCWTHPRLGSCAFGKKKESV